MYIDPAAGSMILQIVAAAAVTAVAFMSRVRQGIRAFFAQFFSRRAK